MYGKLASLKGMFLSTRPVSVLYLESDPEDDPDLSPVGIDKSDEVVDLLAQTRAWESKARSVGLPDPDLASPSAESAWTTLKRKREETPRTSTFEEHKQNDDQGGGTVRVRGASLGPLAEVTERGHPETSKYLSALNADNEDEVSPDSTLRPSECLLQSRV